ncbi:MAG TPA: translation initiation factor IF-3 [Ktedonobacterales bacterium]
MNRDFRGDNRQQQRELRINDRVRAREVRLIDEEGNVIGVMSSMQANAIARERNLDLVEVSPMAVPPVCRLMDYGRFKYEQQKKENEARKRQKTSELKEIRMRPKTDDHDMAVKARKVEEFLGEGDKVKVAVVFRGREMAHPDLGRRLLDQMVVDLKNVAAVERPPMLEGRMMSMILTRAPGWEPPKKSAPVTRERKNRGGSPDVSDARGQRPDEMDEVDEVDEVDDTAPEAEAVSPESTAPAQ